MPRIAKSAVPDLVVAFGTAATPLGSGYNGSVVVGTSVFVHDPYQQPPNLAKHWRHERLDAVVSSPYALPALSTNFGVETAKRLFQPPNAAATPPRVTVDSDFVSIGVVNVTDSAHYAWTDPQALAKFAAVAPKDKAACVETTHGLIRLVLNLPFIYVSGLANAVGRYEAEVKPNLYAQNFAAGHNAAIATAWLLPELVANGAA